MPAAVFLYRRVSTDVQDHSTAAQEAVSTAYVQRLGLTVTAEFSDADTSGTIPFAQRPQGARLLAAAAAVPADTKVHVVFTFQDRMGRDWVDAGTTARQLWKSGDGAGVLHFSCENGALPWSPDNEMMLGVKAVVAQRDVAQIRLRIRTVIGSRRGEGYCVGTEPYGWRKADTGRTRRRKDGSLKPEFRLEPDPEQQRVLREIILPRRYRDKVGTVRIARELNDLAIPTRQAPGELVKGHQGLPVPSRGIWTQRHVDRILANLYTAQVARELGFRE